MLETIRDSAIITFPANQRKTREAADKRHFVRVSLRGVVWIGDKLYPVEDFSLGGIKLKMAAHELPDERPTDCELVIPRRGEQLSIAFSIVPVFVDADNDKVGFRIADIDDDRRDILQQLIVATRDSAVITTPAEPRLTRDAPNNRHFVRVSLSAKARIGDRLFTVEDFSLGGLRLIMPANELPVEMPIDCEIVIPRRGAQLSVAFSVLPVFIDTDLDRIGFRIADIGAEERDVLRQLIVSHLNGAEIDGVKLAQNMIAFPSVKDDQLVRAKPKPGQSPTRQKVVGYTVWSVFALMLAGALGLTIFNSVFGVSSVSAAVSAPAVEIRAPNSGIVRSKGVQVGDVVSRDQVLLQINDLDLEVELEIARAAVDPRGGTAAEPDHEQRLAMARLLALETRRASNTIYSPCDCVVHAINGAHGGEWSNIGDRLMVLIPQDPESILIYSLVPAEKVRHLTRQQKVDLNFPLTGESMVGTVESILMRDEQNNRVGMPGWYSDNNGTTAVMIRPDTPLAPRTVGQPVDMTAAGLSLR